MEKVPLWRKMWRFSGANFSAIFFFVVCWWTHLLLLLLLPFVICFWFFLFLLRLRGFLCYSLAMTRAIMLWFGFGYSTLILETSTLYSIYYISPHHHHFHNRTLCVCDWCIWLRYFIFYSQITSTRDDFGRARVMFIMVMLTLLSGVFSYHRTWTRDLD